MTYPGPPGPGYHPPGQGYPGAPQRGNGLAVAALVLGIIGIVLFWFPVIGWIPEILAVVFGAVGLANANKGASSKGVAIAGLVLGIVGVALALLILIAYVHD